MSAREYGMQGNFKGDDPPGGTDLSARLSFGKRAREVKAANEAAVFKEDYPRDDKSIADDERPNRSRASKPSRTRTYRKSISDAEKSGRERNAERSRKVRDNEDARISSAVDEKSAEVSGGENESISDTYRNCSPANVITILRIRRKRISRGVQYDISVGRQRHAGCFPLDCLKWESSVRKYKLTQEKKQAVGKKFAIVHGSRNKGNARLPSNNKKTPSNDAESEEPRDTAKEREESTSNANPKKEEFENGKGGKIEKIIDRNENGERKGNAETKDITMAANHSGRSWVNHASTRTRQNGSCCSFDIADSSRDNKKKIAQADLRNERTNGEYLGGQNRWDIKIVDRKANSIDLRENANPGRRVDAKMTRRLDSCIAELKKMIGDTRTIFGGGKSATRRSD